VALLSVLKPLLVVDVLRWLLPFAICKPVIAVLSFYSRFPMSFAIKVVVMPSREEVLSHLEPVLVLPAFTTTFISIASMPFIVG